MSCTEVPIRFRLLDANVGWEPAKPLVGKAPIVLYDDLYGLRLNNREEPRLSNELISSYLPPATFTLGCAPSEWYLCGVEPVTTEQEALLIHHDPCNDCWIDLRPRLAQGTSLYHPMAIAVTKRRLAVIDKRRNGSYRVLIWSIPDGRLAGLIELRPNEILHSLVFSSWHELVVSVTQTDSNVTQMLLRFDLTGQFRGKIEVSKAIAPMTRLRTANDGSLWAAEGNLAGPFALWRISVGENNVAYTCEPRSSFSVERLTDSKFYYDAKVKLQQAFRAAEILSIGENYFCIGDSAIDKQPKKLCFGFDGERFLKEPSLKANLRNKQSEVFLTDPIDSFIPRCKWHRVRVEADLPANTMYTIEVATNEDTQRPNDLDWQLAVENATDFLIDQPPGQFLFLRIKLTGVANTTPVIRRVRIDFPRVTSLDQLPAVYRENIEAEDFTERFLSLFDAATEDLDRAIERFPAMLDPVGVPEEVLVWLGSLLGIVFDADSSPQLRRELLNAAPSLYRKRGTVAGLKQAIKLIYGVEPVIDERAMHRAWGVVNQNARLGSIRLFGKSESRFRVGRSALGAAPLRSYGNPDHDPARLDAHRFTVLMPPCPALSKLGFKRLDQLIENQKPAHTRHHLRVGGQGFIIGHRSIIGIDTQFVAPPPVVLAPGLESLNNAVRLGTGVLRSGSNRPTSSMHLGVSSTIGIQTQLE